MICDDVKKINRRFHAVALRRACIVMRNCSVCSVTENDGAGTATGALISVM